MKNILIDSVGATDMDKQYRVPGTYRMRQISDAGSFSGDTLTSRWDGSSRESALTG
jgi:hypothetical protein